MVFTKVSNVQIQNFEQPRRTASPLLSPRRYQEEDWPENDVKRTDRAYFSPILRRCTDAIVFQARNILSGGFIQNFCKEFG